MKFHNNYYSPDIHRGILFVLVYNQNMKIAFFSLRESFQDYIKKTKPFGRGHKIYFFESPLDIDHLPDKTDFDVISVFVDSRVDVAVLNKFSKLKFISTRSTGVDHIDAVVCKKRGIKIANVPVYGENTVAEHAFGLLLALSKRIFDGYHQLRENTDFNPRALEGFDLKGKTLGVVGTGNIGQYAIKIGNGFSMRVIGYDKFPKLELEKKMGFEYVKTLSELLKKSDVITLHVPLLKTTRHLISNKNIMKMKKGAVLINTSRGEVVETEALLKALENKHLAGAGLDVIEGEGEIKDDLEYLISDKANNKGIKTILANHILIDMPNVIMTPHSAFNTKEALQRILNTTIENIKSFL